MGSNLSFSLVVMTYERPVALRRCIDSIDRLDYSKSAYEVIVIDDGSTRRNPLPFAMLYPDLSLRYKWIAHQGVSAARNTGLALAHADLIVFVADDYCLPSDYLSRAEWFFRNYPEAQVLTFNVRSVGSSLACHVQQLYHELVLLQNSNAIPDEKGIIKTFGLPASRAAIFKKEIFELVGTFNERLKAGEDAELAQRLAAQKIPLYFMHKYYIDHHEGRGFFQFLQQRKDYATSRYRISVSTNSGNGDRKRKWTICRCIKVVFNTIFGWGKISWKYDRFLRFFVLWPGLMLFLFRFYFTLYRLEKANFENENYPNFQ